MVKTRVIMYFFAFRTDSARTAAFKGIGCMMFAYNAKNENEDFKFTVRHWDTNPRGDAVDKLIAEADFNGKANIVTNLHIKRMDTSTDILVPILCT